MIEYPETPIGALDELDFVTVVRLFGLKITNFYDHNFLFDSSQIARLSLVVSTVDEQMDEIKLPPREVSNRLNSIFSRSKDGSRLWIEEKQGVLATIAIISSYDSLWQQAKIRSGQANTGAGTDKPELAPKRFHSK